MFFECFKSFTCSKHCIRYAFQKGERKATFSDFITLHPLYQNQKSHRCHTVCDNNRRAVLLTLLGWLVAWFGWLLVARRSCSISERRARRTGGDHGVAVSQKEMDNSVPALVYMPVLSVFSTKIVVNKPWWKQSSQHLRTTSSIMRYSFYFTLPKFMVFAKQVND